MKIIIDARALQLYPVGQPTEFTGGTELMVHKIAKGLAGYDHTVHVVCPDLEVEEQRGESLWYWGPNAHPSAADAVVMVHSLQHVADYSADYLIMATNGVDPDLGPQHSYASGVDMFPVFSIKHGEMLRQFRPTVPEEKLVVTGLGIDWEQDYHWLGEEKVPGRMLYANDPARGLWHVLDIFDHLKTLNPDVTLHVAYDFDKQFEHHKWSATALAEVLWECKQRLGSTPGVTNMGGLSRSELVREQLECQIHAMPSDPPNAGSQIHGITQMECAAAGAALVLADYEAFPEVFGEAAMILPQIGLFLPKSERRYDALDWAEAINELMHDSDKLADMAKKSRELAARHTWGHVANRWSTMLGELAS